MAEMSWDLNDKLRKMLGCFCVCFNVGSNKQEKITDQISPSVYGRKIQEAGQDVRRCNEIVLEEVKKYLAIFHKLIETNKNRRLDNFQADILEGVKKNMHDIETLLTFFEQTSQEKVNINLLIQELASYQAMLQSFYSTLGVDDEKSGKIYITIAKITERFSQDIPLLELNKQEISQVLIALLRQSVHYKIYNKLEISTDLKGGKIVIRISNTGKRHKPALIDSVNAHPSIIKKGLDVGLKVSRIIIGKYHGTVDYRENKTARRGFVNTTFTITLPVASNENVDVEEAAQIEIGDDNGIGTKQEIERQFFNFIHVLKLEFSDRPLTESGKIHLDIIDLGTRTGRVPYMLKKLLDKNGFEINIVGIDENLNYLDSQWTEDKSVKFIEMYTQDALDRFGENSFDVVIWSGFGDDVFGGDALLWHEGLKRLLRDDGMAIFRPYAGDRMLINKNSPVAFRIIHGFKWQLQIIPRDLCQFPRDKRAIGQLRSYGDVMFAKKIFKYDYESLFSKLKQTLDEKPGSVVPLTGL